MDRNLSLRSEDGQAATELALVFPILLVILIAIAQFGILFNNYITLTDATRTGARKAAVSRFTGDQGAAATLAVRALWTACSCVSPPASSTTARVSS